MEETLIVVMLKDVDGFLDKELGSYKVEDEHGYIYNTYAIEEDGKYMIYLKLTCDRDVDDWEFEAIYDYYDVQSLPDFVRSVKEVEDCYNPTWLVSFEFTKDESEMENRLQSLLKAHQIELNSVYEAIIDKKDEYDK
ncbi:MAG: hypothetical protein KHZ62_04265 [Clostridiales bacterium]|nr:hypothetical protein [Clostridiales bacterium]